MTRCIETGNTTEFPMNMNQKEQLHDGISSMMQSQHLPVSSSCKTCLWIKSCVVQADARLMVCQCNLAVGEVHSCQLWRCKLITLSATTAACNIIK